MAITGRYAKGTGKHDSGPELVPLLRWVSGARRELARWTILVVVLAAVALPARASVALLMEEPFGDFGAFNPTGHAAVYLNHVCAASPTELRMCEPGEFGVVISRYHKIDGYDWIAMPLIPYLYSVENISEIPSTMDKRQEEALRDAYRRAHLEMLAPDTRKGKAPGGEWIQLVGSSYDRRIHGFQVESTREQDERFIAVFNDRRDVGHFNLFFHNCADFSRVVLDIYFPHAIHRNFIADVGLTTPKQVAKSLIEYSRRHPELEMQAFIIPQVPGSLGRSHPVDGVAESLVKSKKYLLPLAVLNPELTGGVIIAYLAEGRLRLPKDPEVFDVADEEVYASEAGAESSHASGVAAQTFAPAAGATAFSSTGGSLMTVPLTEPELDGGAGAR